MNTNAVKKTSNQVQTVRYLLHLQGIIHDPVAPLFLQNQPGESFEQFVTSQNVDVQKFFRVIAYIKSRTETIHAAIRESIDQGIKQIIILGSGHTHFPYVFFDEGVHFFEVDMNSMAHKSKKEKFHKAYPEYDLSRIHGIGCKLPGRRGELQSMLQNHPSFIPDIPCLVILEGLLYYLSKEENTKLFDAIRSFVGQGSLIVGDYLNVAGLLTVRLVQSGGIIGKLSRLFTAHSTDEVLLNIKSGFNWLSEVTHHGEQIFRKFPFHKSYQNQQSFHQLKSTVMKDSSTLVDFIKPKTYLFKLIM